MIRLKNFTELDKQEIKLIFKWRNDTSIAQFMRTKKISIKEHLKFIKNLHKDSSKKYFLVFKDEQSIGVIDFVNISENSCEFGLYAKPNLKGVGNILMNEIKKYAFENLKVKNLKAYVFKSNHRALSLYLKHYFYIYSEDENIFYVELKQTTNLTSKKNENNGGGVLWGGGV
ncbi:UDP-4-amino-4,6-dideoxy-N-acetyl-beta-L-altrosamine N-acetyltransferase [Campylobacter sp. VTCC 70190]|uniref:UDP-4-amino-4, 6-dideoxy-N-acetyl-beta-L-altrosamine N-acetyltransferase n=1 Tax=Campylobacter sp. VTCC 70190 TaxID=3392118 RepID=UPI00398E66B2